MLKELHPGPSRIEISPDEISVLVRQAQSQNQEAFAELLRRFESRLHRHALFLTGDEQQALDLLQETALETWRHLHRYDGRATFFTWMCSIMLHRHYDWLRRIRTRAFGLFASPEDDQVPTPVLGPGELASQLEHARLVRECLDELPPRQRTVVYLRFYAGESLEGIAAATRSSIGTVKSRLFHGLKRLAKMQKIKELRIG